MLFPEKALFEGGGRAPRRGQKLAAGYAHTVKTEKAGYFPSFDLRLPMKTYSPTPSTMKPQANIAMSRGNGLSFARAKVSIMTTMPSPERIQLCLVALHKDKAIRQPIADENMCLSNASIGAELYAV
jgi:hypothetical protein